MLLNKNQKETKPSLQIPFWPGAVTPDRIVSMGQTKLNSVLMLN